MVTTRPWLERWGLVVCHGVPPTFDRGGANHPAIFAKMARREVDALAVPRCFP